MGIFNRLFGKENNSESEKKLAKVAPWIPLASVDQLAIIKERSKARPQVIFKHSTTCGISRMVMNRFNEGYDISKDSLDLHYLDLHQYRPVSNETSNVFGVVHESPQLLVIKNGVVVAHESHGAITHLDLNKYI
ncbi:MULTISPECIES: bacillithiol system redox-active protein YtxJ [unclassified Arenibacter]|jgi:bacillithiol system protein YtxJ|uniref:bacillithiol system redox-active protein YtxJ n=1 Tax=unclassified Arenibacter TaxID=2615047 RepID=UPI000E353B49|nr:MULTISPECIES: bacillithiol system redox-active protein YtxJ [unclassified Arenibacter]MCM4163484.1 bacillithiol system redox-active protein YtxJ [Arenibacter sp. A80]RFT57478.1 bacillithiol system redox-active protein YtxJ [Arenibacter sp. P308M17]